MFEKYTKYLPIDEIEAKTLQGYGVLIKEFNGERYMDCESAHKIIEDTFRKAVVMYNDIDERTLNNNEKLEEQKGRIETFISTLDEFTSIISSIKSKIKDKEILLNNINITAVTSFKDEILSKLESVLKDYQQKSITLFEEYESILNTKKEEAGKLLLNNINDKFNNNLEGEIRKITNKKLSEMFTKIGIDVNNLLKNVKVALVEPLPLVKYTIREIQIQGKSPIIDNIENLREQIKISITEEDVKKEVIEVIKSLDNYTDNNNPKPVLSCLRNLQWKLESEDVSTEEVVNTKEEEKLVEKSLKVDAEYSDDEEAEEPVKDSQKESTDDNELDNSEFEVNLQ